MSLSAPLIRRLAVVGVGLIGGSFARAVRASGAVSEVVGIDHDPVNLARAVALGVIDRGFSTFEEGVAEAEVVFVATPVCSVSSVVAAIVPYVASGTIITDGGSVKGDIVSECEKMMPPSVFFVGGHPIAGTEQSGVDASFAELYRGRRCILTPSSRTPQHALELVTKLWQAAGSDVVLMDPVKHDHVVSAISHLPHMVAYSLVNAVGSYNRFEESILKYSAGGFRDFTRIASSDPVMWRDISLMNRDAILEMMDFFTEKFASLRKMIEEGDAPGLTDFFERSKRSRDAIL